MTDRRSLPGRPPWTSRLRPPKDIAVLTLATLVGLALVVWGWLMQGSEYTPGLLLQFGSSLVLIVPLIVLGRVFERRMQRTQDALSSDLADIQAQMRATRARLDTLGETSRDGLLDRHRRRELLLREAERAPTAERLASLLHEAAGLQAVDDGGVRTRLPGSDLWLRLDLRRTAAAQNPVQPDRSTDETLHLTLEDRGGTAVSGTAWTRDEQASAAARRLTARRAGAAPGTASAGTAAAALRDIDGLLRLLVATLRTAIAARTGQEPQDLGRLIELPNEQWAISADGLWCRQRYFHVRTEQLLDARQDWRRYALTKPWVDREHFLDAHRTAHALLSGPASPSQRTPQ
ncbi:hypothetical protein IPZ58_12260 [Streptomyces roseoverticillatus]|uniref:hypothetical protein n=1 Tax=Streptomyces roseoverticillatus TaxID=66429 RepID=UPI001F1B4058|nr:hypothetical protein [Streptomyces roseoverticillatus]MCF3102353.1 hypothetical protein [Streptomyces roseoverticillatus]